MGNAKIHHDSYGFVNQTPDLVAHLRNQQLLGKLSTPSNKSVNIKSSKRIRGQSMKNDDRFSTDNGSVLTAQTSSKKKKSPIETMSSKLFRHEQIIYVFEDNQYIQAGSEENGFKDATPSYTFDLTERFKKYLFFVEGVPFSDQPMSPDKLIQT